MLAVPRPERSAQITRFVLLANKLATLFGFLVLLTAGWVGLCYIKSSFAGGPQSSASEASTRTSSPLAVQADQTSLAGTGVPGQSSAQLVYSVSGDNTYFHSSAHRFNGLKRSAMSEEAARSRGLKPCPVCHTK